MRDRKKRENVTTYHELEEMLYDDIGDRRMDDEALKGGYVRRTQELRSDELENEEAEANPEYGLIPGLAMDLTCSSACNASLTSLTLFTFIIVFIFGTFFKHKQSENP